MAVKDMCCGLCAWFSVIGAIMYFTMAVMLIRNNKAVIEHKFHISDTEDVINAWTNKMIVMSIIMIASSLVCFIMQCVYVRKERIEDEEQKVRQHQEYNVIFKNEVGKP